MKKLFNSLLFILVVNNAQAAGVLDDVMFGVSVIKQDINSAVDTSGNIVNEENSGTGFGVYIDKYYKKKYRFNSALSYVSYDLFELTELSVSTDYLVPLNQKVSFFTGLSAGGGMQQYTDASISEAAFGFIYGAEIGGLAYINKNIMMELGYRQKISSIEIEVIGSNTAKTTLDEISEFYLNILLMF